MKKGMVFGWVMVLAMVLGLSAMPRAYGQSIKNPGYELGTTNWYGWGPNLSLVTETNSSGQVNVVAEYRAQLSLKQLNVPIPAGATSVTIAVDVKRVHTTKPGTVNIFAAQNGRSGFALNYVIPSDGEYHTVTINFPVVPATGSLNLFQLGVRTDCFRIDNWRLVGAGS